MSIFPGVLGIDKTAPLFIMPMISKKPRTPKPGTSSGYGNGNRVN
jgi:hypothetical protein